MNFLLDTGVLLPFFKGRTGATTLVRPLLAQNRLMTSILVYGEVIEYLKSQPDFLRRRKETVTCSQQTAIMNEYQGCNRRVLLLHHYVSATYSKLALFRGIERAGG